MFLTNHRIKGGRTVLTCRNNEMIFHENEGNLRKAHGMKGGCGLKVQTYFQRPVGEGMKGKKKRDRNNFCRVKIYPPMDYKPTLRRSLTSFPYTNTFSPNIS